MEENIPDLKIGNLFNYSGDSFHHLVKVARIKNGESVCVLNGKGKKYFGEILSVTKKNLEIIIKEITNDVLIERSCAISIIKRDSLELSIRSAVELGVTNIVFVSADFSQNVKINHDRIEKIITSSLIQSNNAFKPKMSFFDSMDSFVEKFKDKIVVFHKGEKNTETSLNSHHHESCVLVGPEGGFSDREISLFKENELRFVSINSPILRAETALVAAITKSLLSD